jgi:hypothetical protein
LSVSENSQQERTEVLYGVESAVRRGVQFMQNAKKWMDLYGDENGPSIIIEFPDIYNNYIEARRRGAKIRFITEITKANFGSLWFLVRLYHPVINGIFRLTHVLALLFFAWSGRRSIHWSNQITLKWI